MIWVAENTPNASTHKGHRTLRYLWHIVSDGLFLTAVGWLIAELISSVATPEAISALRQFDNEVWAGWSQLDPFNIARLYWQNFWPDHTLLLMPLEALVKTIIALWNTGGVARAIGLIAVVLGVVPMFFAILISWEEVNPLWIALACLFTIAMGSVAALAIQGFMLATASLLNFAVSQFDIHQQPISNTVSSTSLLASFCYHCISRGSEHSLSALAVGGIKQVFRALLHLFQRDHRGDPSI